MRAANTCSVEKRGDTYRVRARLPDGTRRVVESGFATEEAAEHYANAVAGELSAFRPIVSVPGATLTHYGRRWLVARERDGMRSVRSERPYFERHIATTGFASRAMRDISVREVREWVRELGERQVSRTVHTKNGTERRSYDKRLTRTTVKQVLGILRRILDGAVEDGIIETNPAKGIKVPKQAKTDEGWTYLTQAEIDTLLSSDKIPEGKRLAYAVAIFTGMRLGELLGLRWDDVHLDCEHPQVIVRHSYDGPTKSGRVRTLPLLPQAAAALRSVKELSANATGLVWPSEGGGCHTRGFDFAWSSRNTTKLGMVHGYKTKAGISRHVRFHDLRHTCASHLVSGTWGRAWRIEEVREYLGHTSITMTQRYAHFAPDGLRRAVASTPGPAAVPVRRDNVQTTGGNTNDSTMLLARPEGFEPPTFRSEV